MGALWQALTEQQSFVQALQGSRFAKQLSLDKSESLSLTIARAIQLKQFVLSPPTETYIKRGESERRILSYRLADYLVCKVMYNTLTAIFKKTCSTGVYGYIPGRYYFQAISKFLVFLKQHTKDRENVDLWIIKSDIKSFGRSIPVGSHSQLWLKLNHMLREENDLLDDNLYLKQLLRDAIQPVYLTEEGCLLQNTYGLPTGSPIENVMLNIYLSDIDLITKNYPDVFYARFGDDILIAGHHKQNILAIESELKSKVNQLELMLHPKKHQRIYFSKSGYKPDNDDYFIGTNSFRYLGLIIYANGMTQPSHFRLHDFLNKCRKEIQSSYNQCQNKSVEEQGKLICQQLKTSLLHLDVDNIFDYNGNCNAMLRSNQHKYLAEIDRKIALMVAEKLSMSHGLRAFRFIPYKKIRSEWNLPSLVQIVNKFHSSKR